MASFAEAEANESLHAVGRPPKFGAVFLVKFEEFNLPERSRSGLLDERDRVQAGVALRHLGNSFRIAPSSTFVTGEGSGPSHGRLCKRIRQSQQFDERGEPTGQRIVVPADRRLAADAS
jgi:hypothetical protein